MTAQLAIDSEEDKRVVLLIDLSSLFWSAWHSSGGDEISSARRRTIDAVHRCIGDFKHRLIAICCDSGRSFRKDLDEAYKANRPEKDHATLGELDRIKEALRDDGFVLWEAKGFEADDVIATGCKEAVARGHHVVIASADKDLLQLLAFPGVKALRTHNWTTVDREMVTAQFGVPPEQLGDWLALVGDASDNVKGVPSVGPKTATTLLAKHGSLSGVLACVESKPAEVGTPAVARALSQNVETVKLARKLVELRMDVPLEFEQIFAPRVSKAQLNKSPEEKDMDVPDPNFVDGAAPAAAPPVANGQPKTNGTSATAAPKQAAQVAEVVDNRQIAVVAPAMPFELALEPTSLGIAFKLSEALWESRLYSRFPSSQAIAAVIIRGRELGIPALQALELFHVIEGKPAPIAHFIISLAERDPNCEYFMYVGGDATFAEYETKHRKRAEPTRFKYTIEEAAQAGYCQIEAPPRDWNAKDGKDHRGQWDKLRGPMLRKTCGVQLARLIYPTATLGLYSAEELGGGE